MLTKQQFIQGFHELVDGAKRFYYSKTITSADILEWIKSPVNSSFKQRYVLEAAIAYFRQQLSQVIVKPAHKKVVRATRLHSRMPPPAGEEPIPGKAGGNSVSWSDIYESRFLPKLTALYASVAAYVDAKDQFDHLLAERQHLIPKLDGKVNYVLHEHGLDVLRPEEMKELIEKALLSAQPGNKFVDKYYRGLSDDMRKIARETFYLTDKAILASPAARAGLMLVFHLHGENRRLADADQKALFGKVLSLFKPGEYGAELATVDQKCRQSEKTIAAKREGLHKQLIELRTIAVEMQAANAPEKTMTVINENLDQIGHILNPRPQPRAAPSPKMSQS